MSDNSARGGDKVAADKTSATDQKQAKQAEQNTGVTGDGDYVLTLADGTRVRAGAPVATEHNGQRVVATQHAPAE